MTAFDEFKGGPDHVQVSWTPPQFQPYWYQQITSCNLLCDHRTYHLTEVLVDAYLTKTTTAHLRPGSICVIKLTAIYNPASIDPGLGIIVHTTYTSKEINPRRHLTKKS